MTPRHIPARRPARRTSRATQAAASATRRRTGQAKRANAQPSRSGEKVPRLRDTAMPPKMSRTRWIWMQLVVAGSAALVLFVLGLVQQNIFSTRQSAAEDAPAAAISVNHDGRASLDFLIARKGDAGYISIENRSPGPVELGLPAAWRRTEVRAASLDDITGSVPTLGFRTWQMPGNTGMKMLTADVPGSLLIENRSPDVLAIAMQSIDLHAEQRMISTHLLQDAPLYLELWRQEHE